MDRKAWSRQQQSLHIFTCSLSAEPLSGKGKMPPMRPHPPHPPVPMHQSCLSTARASEMKGSRIAREEDKEHGPQMLHQEPIQIMFQLLTQLFLRAPSHQLDFHHICDSTCKTWNSKRYKGLQFENQNS